MHGCAIRFDLRPSRTVAVWTAAVHGGGLLAVWGSAIPVEASTVLSLVAACSFVRVVRLHALRRDPNAVIWLEVGRALRVGFADGRVHAARLRAPPFVHSQIVVVRLASDDRRAVVLVPPDALASRARHKELRRSIRDGTPS